MSVSFLDLRVALIRKRKKLIRASDNTHKVLAAVAKGYNIVIVWSILRVQTQYKPKVGLTFSFNDYLHRQCKLLMLR